MIISLSNLNIQNKPHLLQRQKGYTSSPLAPLSRDTVSFGAMKKPQFEGVDYAVVEKFKAPIEKFNTNEDLQEWAGIKTQKLIKTDFGGRQEETKIQRKAMLKEWADYVLKENDAYNNATALLILNAITKDLKPDNDKLPPVLNKGVLADCISEIDKNTKADKKYKFDLKKMYETKLCAFYLKDTNTGETGSKWVIIPSKKKDPENFEANVEKLKTLSHKNWCTKSFNAEPFLSKGDFHVYLENGQPKLGVRFVGNNIQEIQGEKNNGKIPVSYLDEMKNHIEENDLKLRYNVKAEMLETEKLKAEIEKIQSNLKEAIEKKDAKAIFEYLNIDVKEDKDGFLTISEYDPINENYSYNDIGIDENWLIKNVKNITGNANFMDSDVKSLGNLETIGGNADFMDSKVKSLGKLKYIGGYAYFSDSQVQDLCNLETIGGDADFQDSQVQDLGKLETIGGDARFQNSQIKDLANLESIGGNADFRYSQIKDLGNLESIGGNADFRYSQIKDLGNLELIGGDADFSDSQVQDLGKLKSIGRNAYFEDSQVQDLGKLKSIGRKVYLDNCLLSKKDKKKLIAMLRH